MNALPQPNTIVFCRFLRALGCVTLLLMGGIAVNAQPLAFQWARQSVGSSDGSCLAADSFGDVYVGGIIFAPTVSFGGISVSNFLASSDAYVAKYDTSGKVLWVRQGGNVRRGGSARITDVKTDDADNVYAAGYFIGNLHFGGSLTYFTNLISSGYDGFIAKFNPQGAMLWLRQIESAAGGDSLLRTMSLDGAGNVSVAGQFSGRSKFGTTNLDSSGSLDCFLARYNTNGDLIWARQMGGTNIQYASAIAADRAGNCYVAGSFWQTINFGTTNIVTTNELSNSFFSKYNADGELQWAKTVGVGSFVSYKATIDTFGNPYITGAFDGAVAIGGSNVVSGGRADMFIAKFDSEGSLQWLQHAGDIGGFGDGRDIAVDSIGTVYVSGRFRPAISFGTNRLESAGGDDGFVAQYSADGAVRWAARIGGVGNDSATGLAVGVGYDTYLSGWFSATVSLDEYVITSVPAMFLPDASMFVAKLVPFGRARPNISAQPTSRTVTAGQSASFIVAATGSRPLRYQWFKNTASIQGATNATYSIPVVAVTDGGNYSVAVSNSEDSETSSNAVLTVLASPIFGTNPISQTVGVGSNVTLSATAYGAPPLVFQWFFNGSPVGVPIAGTNVAALTLANVQVNQSGNYSVQVFNGVGSATSSDAALSVVVFPPKFVTQPFNQNLLLGVRVFFTVSVSGTAPFHYQWRLNGADLPGATNSTYTIPAIAQSDAGNYSVEVSNSSGSVTSENAALSVIVPPSLGLQLLAGYPVLRLNGMLGSNFSVQYVSDLAGTNWLNLRSISNLSVSPYQFLDIEGSTPPARFYRAIMQ